MSHNLRFMGENLEVRVFINGSWVESLPLIWKDQLVLHPSGWGEGLAIADGPYVLHQMFSEDLANFITECIHYWNNEDGGVMDHEMILEPWECACREHHAPEDILVAWAVRPREEEQ